MLTDEEWLERVAQASVAQVVTLFVAFVGALGIGWAASSMVVPGSELAVGLSVFAFLLVLGIGYKLWMAYLTAVLTKAFLGGLLAGLIRFLFSRRREEAERSMQSLVNSLKDPDRARAAVAKIRRKASIFRSFGLLLGVVAGFVAGLSGPDMGFLNSVILYALAGLGYGWILTYLGREGLLPLPSEI